MADTAELVRAQEPATGGGRRRGFWNGLPGFLTAMAAVLSAAVPLYLHLAGGDEGRGRPNAPTYVILNAPASVFDRVTTADPGLKDPVDGCMQGDGAACAQVAEALVEECDGGDGEACDWLYELADRDSDLELYGASCGYRFDTDEYAGTCADVI